MVGKTTAAEGGAKVMSRGWDERTDGYGHLPIASVLTARRGRLMLLAVFLGSMGAGAGIGFVRYTFGVH